MSFEQDEECSLNEILHFARYPSRCHSEQSEESSLNEILHFGQDETCTSITARLMVWEGRSCVPISRVKSECE